MEYVIRLQSVTKRYGSQTALDRVTLEVPSGVEGLVIQAEKFSRRAAMTDDERKAVDKDQKEIENKYNQAIADQFRALIEDLGTVLDKKEYVIIGLQVNAIEGPALVRLPSDVRDRLGRRAVTLEELLSLRPGATLRIAVRAAHHFSGYKRTYALQYREANIRDGVFRDGLAVEIVPRADAGSEPMNGDVD